jgi:hypothetical protein
MAQVLIAIADDPENKSVTVEARSSNPGEVNSPANIITTFLARGWDTFVAAAMAQHTDTEFTPPASSLNAAENEVDHEGAAE